MKKLLIIVLCCLSTGLYAQNDTLRAISYNIWNGFDFRKGAERQNKVINWLVANKPDMVALQEVCSYAEENCLKMQKDRGIIILFLLKKNVIH